MVGPGGVEGALGDALAHDPGQQRGQARQPGAREPEPDEVVLVGVPGPDQGEQEVAPLALPSPRRGEDRLELRRGGEVRVGSDRLHDGECDVHHPFDDGRQERLLRVEVVVEGPLGRAELVQDVLDGHLLVPLRPDEALGCVQEGVAPEGVSGGVQRARHLVPKEQTDGRSVVRGTIGLPRSAVKWSDGRVSAARPSGSPACGERSWVRDVPEGYAPSSAERSLSSISHAWSSVWKAECRMRNGSVHDRMRRLTSPAL